MMARPKHEAVAEALRERGAPDEVARARMEKRLLAAAAARGSTDAPTRSRRRPWIAVGAGVVVAAAAAALLWLRPATDEPPVARFEVRDVGAAAERGTLEEGSVLRTAEGEVADVRIADSTVRLTPGSEVRIATLGVGRLALELTRGEVQVEFHPRRRGEEHLSVTTAEARVEVVGTVFTVRAAPGATEVSVTEGRVRVASRRGGDARLVSAGESTRVEAAATAEAAPTEATSSAEATEPASSRSADGPTEPGSTEPGSTELAEDESAATDTAATDTASHDAPTRRAPSAARRLARARAALADGRGDEAERELRGLLAGRAPTRVRAEALTLLGDVLRRTGRSTEAATVYEQAADLDAGSMSHMAIYALARLQQRELGQPSQARRSYRRYLTAAPQGPLAAPARAALCRLGDEASCSPQ